MPPFLGCALKSENGGELGSMVDYTSIWNALHVPSGVVPVS
jgi:hypothetical protein